MGVSLLVGLEQAKAAPERPLRQEALEQAGDPAFPIHVDIFRSRYPGQAGHGHDRAGPTTTKPAPAAGAPCAR